MHEVRSAVTVAMVYTVYRKYIAFTKRQWTSKIFKNIYKMNVDVGISSEKSNRTRQGWDKEVKDVSGKYRKLLITLL